MSRAINQPVGQVRLTNVAVVRLKRAGKRFEIACYKNMALNWRNGVETDIDEVLQIERVFSNVSKGVFAKDADLVKAFGTSDQTDCCKIILRKGQMQVSDKERAAQLESLSHDIATLIAGKTVNPETGAPYPVAAIERAMQEAHVSVKTTHSAKQQALDVIRKLQDVIPLERVRLQVRVDAPDSSVEELQKVLLAMESSGVEHEATTRSASISSIVLLLEPAAFREVEAEVARVSRGAAAVTVLAHAVPVTASSASSSSSSASSSASASSAASAAVTGSHGKAAAAAEAAGLSAAASTSHDASAASASSSATPVAAAAGAFACRKCADARFASREAYREHFRSDWHRVNLKRGLRGVKPLTASEWETLSEEDKAAALVSEDASA